MSQQQKLLEKLHVIRTNILNKKLNEYETNKKIWPEEIQNQTQYNLHKQLYKTKNEILIELNDVIGHPTKLTITPTNTIQQRKKKNTHNHLQHLKKENNLNKILKETMKTLRKTEKEFIKDMRKKIIAMKKMLKINEEHFEDLDIETKQTIISQLRQNKELEKEYLIKNKNYLLRTFKQKTEGYT